MRTRVIATVLRCGIRGNLQDILRPPMVSTASKAGLASPRNALVDNTARNPAQRTFVIFLPNLVCSHLVTHFQSHELEQVARHNAPVTSVFYGIAQVIVIAPHLAHTKR